MTFATTASLKRHMVASHPRATTSTKLSDVFSKDTILEIQTFDDVSQISIDPSNEIYFKDETGNSNYDVISALEVDTRDVFKGRVL